MRVGGGQARGQQLARAGSGQGAALPATRRSRRSAVALPARLNRGAAFTGPAGLQDTERVGRDATPGFECPLPLSGATRSRLGVPGQVALAASSPGTRGHPGQRHKVC